MGYNGGGRGKEREWDGEEKENKREEGVEEERVYLEQCHGKVRRSGLGVSSKAFDLVSPFEGCGTWCRSLYRLFVSQLILKMFFRSSC